VEAAVSEPLAFHVVRGGAATAAPR
jgi:hypothetical protein